MNNEQNNNVQNGLDNTEPVNQENVTPVENNVQPNVQAENGQPVMSEQPVQVVPTVENSAEVVPPISEGKKKKTGLTITLVILGILIVVGIVLGVLWFLNGGSTKNVYYQAIDNLASNAITNINNIEQELDKPIGINANISANMTTSDSSMQTLASLLNKMNINMDMEMDYNNKVSNMTYDIKYNNGSLIKADLVLNNENAFLDLNNLYDKTIKLPTNSEIDNIWQTYDFESYKTVIKEMASILKVSLKEDYFTTRNDKINNINTKVYVLTLSGKDMYNLEIDILNNMLKNQNLLSALNNLAGSDVKETLENIKSNVTETESAFISEIYLNKITAKIEKMTFKVDNSALEFDKTGEDTFDIVLNNDGNKMIIGNAILKENNTTISLKDTGVDITIEFKNENNAEIVNLNFEVYGTYMKLNLERQEENGKVGITLNDDNNNKLTLNVDYSLKNISKVTSKNISNYVELDKMTDNDYNTIMQNLYQNSTLMSLMQSLITM